MSNFNQALNDVFKHEGGFSNLTYDHGGATNYGISLRFLKSVIDGDINGDGHINLTDIRALTPVTATTFYHVYFWQHYRLGEIHDQRVATKLFNCFVNMRGKTAALIAQRAANDLRANVVEDGVLGTQSFSAINELDHQKLFDCIKWRMWQTYRAIIDHDVSQEQFANGWSNRAFSPV